MVFRLCIAGLLLLAACSPDLPIGPSPTVVDALAETDAHVSEVAVDVVDAVVDAKPEIAGVDAVVDANSPPDALADVAIVTAPAGMVLIPAGTFWMGCNGAKDKDCQPNELPQHKVTLSAYYVDLTETTVGQYKTCVDAGVCTVPSAVQPGVFATYPGLSWRQLP